MGIKLRTEIDKGGADAKLTREWVEEELISAEKYGLHRQAALCRHYLATEQDARDVVRAMRSSAMKIAAELVSIPPDFLPERFGELISRTRVVDLALKLRDAALTQKEPQK